MIATTTCAIIDATNTVCTTVGSNFPLNRNELILSICLVAFLLGYQFFDRVLSVNNRHYDV